MKKQIAIFLAAAFLAVQMLSFQHMAEHAFKAHDHNGHPCEISAYFQQSQGFDSAANAPAIAHTAKYVSASFNQTAENPYLSFFALTQNPRAPPAYLHA